MQFTYSPLTNILTILNAVRLIFISSNLLHERQLTSFCCIFCFIGYLLLEKNKKGKKKKWKRDQVNQQCEKILIKTPSFPLLCIKVTNLEAMLEYVWMSICIIFIKRKKMRKEKGSCLSMSCSFFSLSRSFFRFVFKVWCYLGFKWPLFIVFWQCECTHIFKWCWGQSIGNSAVWWSMIWACACGQAKGASLTLSYIHTWHVLI